MIGIWLIFGFVFVWIVLYLIKYLNNRPDDKRFLGVWNLHYLVDSVNDYYDYKRIVFIGNKCFYAVYNYDPDSDNWVCLDRTRRLGYWDIVDNILKVENLGEFDFRFVEDCLILNDEIYVNENVLG